MKPVVFSLDRKSLSVGRAGFMLSAAPSPGFWVRNPPPRQICSQNRPLLGSVSRCLALHVSSGLSGSMGGISACARLQDWLVLEWARRQYAARLTAWKPAAWGPQQEQASKCPKKSKGTISVFVLGHFEAYKYSWKFPLSCAGLQLPVALRPWPWWPYGESGPVCG